MSADKTFFEVSMRLRIAKDAFGKDKFSKEYIAEKLKNGEASVIRGSFSSFVLLRTNNDQVMAVVEEVKQTSK
jgi:hypothetical protein